MSHRNEVAAVATSERDLSHIRWVLIWLGLVIPTVLSAVIFFLIVGWIARFFLE